MKHRNESPDGEHAYLDGHDKEKHRIGKKLAIPFIAALVIAGLFLLGWVLTQEKAVLPEDTPIIRADKSPIKVKPQEPGGMVIANMDKTVYDKLSRNSDNGSKTEKLLPAPEEPIKSIEVIKGEAQQGQNPAEKQVIDILANIPADETGEIEDADEAVTGQESVKEKGGDSSLRPLTENDLQIVTADKNTTQQANDDLPPASNSGYKVQLAAFKTESDAVENWKKIQKAHTELLGKLRYYIERKEIEGKGTFYRLQAGLIDKESEARLLCKKLAEVNQGCFVVE